MQFNIITTYDGWYKMWYENCVIIITHVLLMIIVDDKEHSAHHRPHFLCSYNILN